MEGHGVFYYADGSKREANWKEDKRSGKGYRTYKNGVKVEENYD
jgi:hypothetical protein